MEAAFIFESFHLNLMSYLWVLSAVHVSLGFHFLDTTDLILIVLHFQFYAFMKGILDNSWHRKVNYQAGFSFLLFLRFIFGSEHSLVLLPELSIPQSLYQMCLRLDGWLTGIDLAQGVCLNLSFLMIRLVPFM